MRGRETIKMAYDHAWHAIPQFKIEVGSNIWENDQALSVIVNRPENAVDSATIVANDYKGINYLSKINNLNTLKIYLRYKEKTTTWTQIFQGEVESIQPQLSMNGEILAATARGVGYPFVDMNVFDEYGTESTNPTVDKVSEVIYDIVTNYVEKSFGGAASGHTFTVLTDNTSPSWDVSLTYAPFPFKTALDSLKTLCDLGAAHAGPTNAGPHFIVTPGGKLCTATIGSHTAQFDTDWPTWWRTDQNHSTLQQGKDFLNYTFQDDVKNYFNHIIYAGSLLKPGSGDFCENNSADWAVYVSSGTPYVTDDNSVKKVKSYSIKAYSSNALVGGSLYLRYKKNVSWGYNTTYWGGEIAHPTINFWLRRDAGINYFYLRLCQSDSIYASASRLNAPTANEWYGFSLEIGPYGHIKDSNGNDWLYSGGFNWTNVNYIYIFGDVANSSCAFWVDGLNFQGQLIRTAKDTTKITSDDERQKYIFDSVGKDDTTKAGTPGTTDTGYMARVAKAELLRCAKKPLVGHLTIPCAEDLLPGQLIHIYANQKSDGTFNIDANFRVIELRHVVTVQGSKTELSVTNDLKNSLVNKTYSMANLVVSQLLGKDRESINLKSMAIDLTTPMLTETYST